MIPTPDRPRPGFTLFDLAVATALGLVALGLLLPAVQKARAGDARKRCENNLKKMGSAVQGYATARDDLLPNNLTITPVPGSAPPMNGIGPPYGSWNTLLLPHLGHEKEYRAFDLRYDWSDAKDSTNQKAAAARVPEFVCPGAPNPERTVRTKDAAGTEFAAGVTDYCGVPAAYSNDTQPSNLHAGAMNYRYGSYQIHNTDIGDGTSNTIIVVEMGDKPNGWRAGKLVHDNADKVHTNTGIGSGQWAAPNWNHIRSYSFDGATAFGECAVNCSNGAAIYGFHDGGANALFVDGSVRFLGRANTSQALLIALVTTNGGEPLAAGDF
ncbi:DUF1559 family PulG-like putative transporter [Frigoriglobus tundricola]|uniref:DUF1559 domain-containing protein n=1 Tax=Frigoriglobus tundricola TaxID=2774151 RepID=A0A6M5YI69_9BACT|nr:DUF1559 domain-containing protein [Frigoriglobus tundricola]QJW93735.1 hypothetical protein FTUN_1246 [Frigoriglobus tundricola]